MELWTHGRAALELGVHPRVVERWIKAGKFPVIASWEYTDVRCYRVRPEDVAAFAKQYAELIERATK